MNPRRLPRLHRGVLKLLHRARERGNGRLSMDVCVEEVLATRQCRRWVPHAVKRLRRIDRPIPTPRDELSQMDVNEFRSFVAENLFVNTLSLPDDDTDPAIPVETVSLKSFVERMVYATSPTSWLKTSLAATPAEHEVFKSEAVRRASTLFPERIAEIRRIVNLIARADLARGQSPTGSAPHLCIICPEGETGDVSAVLRACATAYGVPFFEIHAESLIPDQLWDGDPTRIPIVVVLLDGTLSPASPPLALLVPPEET